MVNFQHSSPKDSMRTHSFFLDFIKQQSLRLINLHGVLLFIHCSSLRGIIQKAQMNYDTKNSMKTILSSSNLQFAYYVVELKPDPNILQMKISNDSFPHYLYIL